MRRDSQGHSGLGDHRDNLGSGGRGMQGLFCPVMFWSVVFVMFCSVMLYSVVFVEGARRDEAGFPGSTGTTWGLAAAVCRVGLAGRSVLET